MTTAAQTHEDATAVPAVGTLLDRRVRPVPAVAVRVYRVQDAEGRGPFRPGFSHWWVEERPDHDNLVPWMQQFGHDAIPRTGWPFGKHFGCACRTLGQLRRWFIASEYATLQSFGFQAVSMEADRVLHESEIQLLFQRAKPLRADVSPVDLYGPNAELRRAATGVEYKTAMLNGVALSAGLYMTNVAALKVETRGNGDNIPKAWTGPMLVLPIPNRTGSCDLNSPSIWGNAQTTPLMYNAELTGPQQR